MCLPVLSNAREQLIRIDFYVMTNMYLYLLYSDKSILVASMHLGTSNLELRPNGFHFHISFRHFPECSPYLFICHKWKQLNKIIFSCLPFFIFDAVAIKENIQLHCIISSHHRIICIISSQPNPSPYILIVLHIQYTSVYVPLLG